jgi:hypothetical protein
VSATRKYILDLTVNDDAPPDDFNEADPTTGAPEQLLDWLSSDGEMAMPSWVFSVDGVEPTE